MIFSSLGWRSRHRLQHVASCLLSQWLESGELTLDVVNDRPEVGDLPLGESRAGELDAILLPEVDLDLDEVEALEANLGDRRGRLERRGVDVGDVQDNVLQEFENLVVGRHEKAPRRKSS